jgi:hypothetical protein
MGHKELVTTPENQQTPPISSLKQKRTKRIGYNTSELANASDNITETQEEQKNWLQNKCRSETKWQNIKPDSEVQKEE